ncbi:MAG: RNA polymerase sigma factor [Xanthomonadales bacterium]|nr:RNA polymerase sigma factor [Xanthomonadales bacterium]
MSETTDVETTQALIEKSQSGDDSAQDVLFRRCSERLSRWARGRLPGYARDIADTQDLVQVTLMRAFNQLPNFQSRGGGSFMAYLRTILLNRVKEELRRAGRQPDSTERLDIPSQDPGISKQLQQWQTLERYEKALATLSEGAREAVILRLEFDLPYAEIADEIDSPSADAARMKVARSLKELAVAMDDAAV